MCVNVYGCVCVWNCVYGCVYGCVCECVCMDCVYGCECVCVCANAHAHTCVSMHACV